MEITTNLTGERIKKYLSQGKRFDGRKENEFREIKIEKDISKNAEGSVRVNIGKTEVLVGIKLGIGEPYPDSPEKGNLMTTAELLPLSSPRFESGPPKFPAIELARVIDRGIRESKYIDFDKLCIKKGEKVWTVFVDIYTINDDGNLFDAAGIGAITALRNAKMPKYDKETGKILFGEWTDEKVPLSKSTPISITAHKIGNSFIIDPTREEEDVSEVRITAGISNGIISSMQKGNSESLSMEDMNKILDLLEKTERELFKKLEKFLK